MISQKEFIEASRQFVCVRLETYESKETQDHIRKLLRGTMQNTAFTIYAPDGKTQLTGSGRAPSHVFARFVDGGRSRGRGNASNDKVIEGMEKIAAKYRAKGDPKKAVLQDFDSFKQSLNVASADQRLLVFTVAPRAKKAAVEKTVQWVANDPAVIGKFHFDTADKVDAKWAAAISNETRKTGIFLIQSGEYGQDGKVLAELPLAVSAGKLKSVLLRANAQFAKSEERKNYGEHVRAGKRQGIHFENNMEHGEDRDGDGKIDPKGERRGERRGRRGPRWE